MDEIVDTFDGFGESEIIQSLIAGVMWIISKLANQGNLHWIAGVLTIIVLLLQIKRSCTKSQKDKIDLAIATKKLTCLEEAE